MTITALPAAPSRSDTPANFITKADAFVAAQAVLVTEMNLAIASANQTKWITGTTYAIGDEVWSPADFQAYRAKTAGVSTTDPSADSTNWQRTEVSETSLQNQTYTAYTTAGTSTAYTLTPTPAVAALAENQEFDVEFHTASGATPTLAVSGLTAKLLKYRDTTGAKQAITAAQVPTGWRSRVVYDGTDYIVRDPVGVMTATVGGKVPTPPNNTNTFLRGDATFSSPIMLGTPQATTSGTEKDFTSIPAGTKRITINFPSVSTNGTSVWLVQIGDAGGIETSGYVGGAGNRGGESTSAAGFAILATVAAASAYSGSIELNLENSTSFTWVEHGILSIDASGQSNSSGGAKSLTAELDRIRVTTVNGTDAFDGGEINISYE